MSKEALLERINEEEELDGDMPQEVWRHYQALKSIDGEKEAVAEIMRIATRATKKNIYAWVEKNIDGG